MGRACSAYEERRGVYRVLMGKPEGKRPLGRPTRRWEDNTKMDLQEVGRGDIDWIELDQNRVVPRTHTCDCENEPLGSIKYGELLD